MKYFLIATTLLSSFVRVATATPPQTDIYRGDYFYNFETSSFTPDGSKEPWCVDGNMSKAEEPASGPNGRWGTAHVVVRGVLSPPGQYCNLGGFSRVLTVTQILEVTDKHSKDARVK